MTDHDLLIRIDERTESMHKSIDGMEGRVCALEYWRWFLAGGLAVVGVILTLLK